MKTFGKVDEQTMKLIISHINLYESFTLNKDTHKITYDPLIVHELRVLNYIFPYHGTFNVSNEIIELCKMLYKNDTNDPDILYLYSISLLEKLYNENQNTIKKL
jgi:hypothetical protein